MKDYRNNAKWLAILSPFRNLTISAGYLTPFFFQNGISVARIMLLQAIFTGAYALLTTHGGLFADRYGRVRSIRLGMLLTAIGQTAYGFSHAYWQFIVWELVLAVSKSLISGNDLALLYDSLPEGLTKKDRRALYNKLKQRINTYAWTAAVFGVGLAIPLAHFVSIRSTIVADGLLAAVGILLTGKLVEAVHRRDSEEEESASVLCAAKQLARNAEVRWLVVLGTVLSAATYVSFWLSAPYYTGIGIPVVYFSAILAVRNAFKAFVSRKFKQERHIEANMVSYALMASLVYVTMSTGMLWLGLAVFAHDVVQALSQQPIEALINEHIEPKYRATMNSLVGISQPIVYSAAGPLAGLLADWAGLSVAFVVLAVIVGVVTFVALIRLHMLKTFKEER